MDVLVEGIDYPDEFEREIVVDGWRHQGIACAMAAGRHSINGYVRLPLRVRRKYHYRGEWTDYNGLPFECHGGLTYSRGAWVGFDTAHWGDAWNENVLMLWGAKSLNAHIKEVEGAGGGPLWDPEHWWTLEQLREETNHLAHQVKTSRRR